MFLTERIPTDYILGSNKPMPTALPVARLKVHHDYVRDTPWPGSSLTGLQGDGCRCCSAGRVCCRGGDIGLVSALTGRQKDPEITEEGEWL